MNRKITIRCRECNTKLTRLERDQRALFPYCSTCLAARTRRELKSGGNWIVNRPRRVPRDN